jgi:hypothetical protein
MSLPSYRQICAALAATSDIAFAEYTSGLRYPTHLRALTRFWDENAGNASGALLPRGHAKTTAVIHRVARLIGQKQGRLKVIIATETESSTLCRGTADCRVVGIRRCIPVCAKRCRRRSLGRWRLDGSRRREVHR